MVLVYAKMDFFPQLRQVDPALANRVIRDLRDAALAAGAVPSARDDPFAARFDEDGLFWRLQAVEAAFRFSLILETARESGGDHSVLIHAARGEDEAHAEFRRVWCALDGANGVWISAAAKAALESYVQLEEGELAARASAPSYRGRAEAPDAASLLRRPDLAARIAKTLAAMRPGKPKALMLSGPTGSGMETAIDDALRELGFDPRAFPALRGTRKPRPFSPLCPLATPADAEIERLEGEERQALASLAHAGQSLAASPFRTLVSRQLSSGIKQAIALSLRAKAADLVARGLPPYILCHELHRYSPEALEALGACFEGDFGPILICSGADPAPAAWPSESVRSMAVEAPSEGALSASLQTLGIAAAEAAAIAKAAKGDLSSLAQRTALSARGHPASTAPRSERAALSALLGLPPEAALVLLACELSEGVLRPAEVDAFLCDIGLKPAALALARGILESHGYLGADQETLGLVPVEEIERAFAPRAGAANASPALRVKAALAAHLVDLKTRGRLAADLGFLAAVERLAAPGVPMDSGAARRLALECAYGDVQRDLAGAPEAVWLSAKPAELLRAFAAAQQLPDEAIARRCVDAIVLSGADVFGPGLSELIEAEHLLALRKPREAASKAKAALIAARGSGSRKAESRAQRILGLAGLAQGKSLEALDYLQNAVEIAELVGDAYELMASHEGAVAAQFAAGDAARALRSAEAALEKARLLFRKDHEAWLEFAAGRARFSLGRYEEAIERFRACAALGHAYGGGDETRRAEVWTARALAYAQRGDEARHIFDAAGEDWEARWFLAELEILEGRPAAAIRIAEGVKAPGNLDYEPADAVFWDSGFRGLEHRALGYGQERSAEEDFLEAFRLLARGLAEDDPALAMRINAMTRDQRIGDENPEFLRYFYYCYLLLEDREGASLDKLSMLSRAFKYVQERASRIDEPAAKAAFLERDPWNRGIIEAAKRYKFL